ncbi:MAG: LysM peptidoglycan-binding domain-containing protein [Acidimicrobiia bacterium]|nr:LysM peptidoglycan-binding domain-containing protein [Acidimicrobiia bacterium]
MTRDSLRRTVGCDGEKAQGRRPLFMFTGWLAFLGAILAVALWAGRFPALQVEWGSLELWLATAAPGDIAAAILRQAVIVCAGFQLLMSFLYLAAKLSRVPAAIRAVEWATLPITRRLVHRVVAVSMAASMVGPVGTRVGSISTVRASSVVADRPPIGVIIDEETDSEVPSPNDSPAEDLPVVPEVPPITAPASETPPTDAASEFEEPDQREEVSAGEASELDPDPVSPITSTPETDENAGPGSADAAGTAGATTYVVVRGDNLWTIAATHLASHGGADPSTSSVARYWRAVIDANLAGLRSGNPNLIYPGEVLTLPPVGTLAEGLADEGASQ